jgi:hypothetical protein
VRRNPFREILTLGKSHKNKPDELLLLLLLLLCENVIILSTNSVHIQHVYAMLVIVQDCQSTFHSKLVQYLVPYQNLHVSNSSLSTSNYEQNTIFVNQVTLHYTTNYSEKA